MSNTVMNRRGLLRTGTAAAAGLATPAIFSGAARGYTNEPAGSTVTLGFNLPLSGAYADEGKDELRALELAVEHLNGEGDGGMLQTLSSKALDGAGILGKKVVGVTGDTQTQVGAGRASATAMIETEGAVMITGGSSSAVALEVQELCQQAGVIFMAGLAHSNDLTGQNRKANGFRHFFNAYMSAAALAPVLARTYGHERRAYHLTADYSWGWTQEESLATATEALGWETVNKVKTPLAATDFSSFLEPVLDSGADLLVLNHYGENLVNSLKQAVELGLRDRQVDGKSLEIVVPLYSELMARGAGESIRGILGTQNWNWRLDDPGTRAFVESFAGRHGGPPGQAAHTCYVQTLLYADAVARAGTFNPCGVVEALEDFEFDGLGNGPTLYRADDHQCFKDVLVVRGGEAPQDASHLVEIVEITPARQVTYPPDHPLFAGGELGSCNPGG